MVHANTRHEPLTVLLAGFFAVTGSVGALGNVLEFLDSHNSLLVGLVGEWVEREQVWGGSAQFAKDMAPLVGLSRTSSSWCLD